MKKELFQAIIEKIVKDYGASDIYLYNWGEPLLHPQLPEMIEQIVKKGCQCYLSSNLNFMPNSEALLSAKPYVLRISCSGFRQEIYGVTHRNGNIEKVKANMQLLSAALRKTGSSTMIHVFYHRYLHNMEDEYPMKRFARKLGFGFHPVWAQMMPAEKVVAYLEPQAEKNAITPDDRDLIARLALPLDAAIKCAQGYHSAHCGLRTGQTVLNTDGDVLLCCAIYDRSRFTIGHFLSSSHDELQNTKNIHPYCAICMKHGIHVLYGNGGAYEFDKLAAGNIDVKFANSPALRWERFKKMVFRKIIPAGLQQQAYELYARLVKY